MTYRKPPVEYHEKPTESVEVTIKVTLYNNGTSRDNLDTVRATELPWWADDMLNDSVVLYQP